jgi:hypothetical protein
VHNSEVGLLAAAPVAAVLGGIPHALDNLEGTMTYVKPVVQRFGSLRDVTLGNGPLDGGDATSLYHRS